MTDDTRIPCPYAYPGGRKCSGRIVRIEANNAGVNWTWTEAGGWTLGVGSRHAQYRLHCSEKDTHAADGRPDALAFYFDQLPEAARKVVLPG